MIEKVVPSPMQVFIIPLVHAIDILLSLYQYAVIIYVVMSWLVNFNVVNRSNQFVRAVGQILDQLVEPALMRIRRVLPMFGALDLSPLFLIILIIVVREILQRAAIQWL